MEMMCFQTGTSHIWKPRLSHSDLPRTNLRNVCRWTRLAVALASEAIGRPPPIVPNPPPLSSKPCPMPSPISPSFLLRRLPSLRIAASRSRIPTSPRLSLPQFSRLSQHQRFSATAITMDNKELIHYLADQPPSVVRLEIEKHFEPLSDKQKRYAHFISK